VSALLPDGYVDDAAAAIAGAADAAELAAAERAFAGRGSAISDLKSSIKSLEPADRPTAGKLVADTTARIAELVEARRAELAAEEAAQAGERDRIDLTLGGHGRPRGHLHLVTQVQRELEDIFVGMGYRVVQGPEVEDDWHNFEALNMVPGHPARSMQDTLYVELGDPEQVMLRTHTSPVQIRTMEAMHPPIFVVAPGRTYRNETLDARHSPVFHQIEGLVVDEGITFGHLAGTIEAFTSAYFGKELKSRLLPSFYPFTEPSAEFAITCVFCDGAGCRVCSKTGWIELGGCGMVDPNVFAAVGYDPERYTGFAFGFGLDRLGASAHGVDDLRDLFTNDIRFLSQF
jgi:phenylalanyl-tRNA synthetase alpha chain